MKMDPIITVHAQFLQKGSNAPLCGPDFRFRLYDKDIIDDDFLGESGLDEDGKATVEFNLKDIRSFDSPDEKYPDLYFVLSKNDHILYKSKVLENLEIEDYSSFSFKEGMHYQLGTFIVEE